MILLFFKVIHKNSKRASRIFFTLKSKKDYNNFSSHSLTLKPTRTMSSLTKIGLFTSIPSVDKRSNCSSSDMSGSLSLSLSSLYFIPLVLKNLLSGKSDISHHLRNSSLAGLSSIICLDD